jgi:hypothetical protein
LRNQCRASASPRESRLNGSGCRNAQFCPGGRHHRQLTGRAAEHADLVTELDGTPVRDAADLQLRLALLPKSPNSPCRARAAR